jgi:hypothetical protein
MDANTKFKIILGINSGEKFSGTYGQYYRHHDNHDNRH